MKRLLTFTLAALLALALAAPALADVIAIPEDDFLRRHLDDCTIEDRDYYTNGSAGYVTLYDRPEGKPCGVLPNGEMHWVRWTYGDSVWGVFYLNENYVWVHMTELSPDYDSDAFLADHESELAEEERSIKTRREDGDALYCYTYPGSGEVKYRLSWDFYVPGETSYSTLFTDSAGRTWGYQSYYQGRRDFWVCLDDPCNGSLPADENYVDPLTGLTPAADPAALETAAKALRPPGSYAYLLVFSGAVIVVAAALLAAAVKRKKKNL